MIPVRIDIFENEIRKYVNSTDFITYQKVETTCDASDKYGEFVCEKCGCHIRDDSVIEEGLLKYCPDCGRYIVD